jgi:short-subunit dehydrogenase
VTAVIVGASAGLGRALAEALAAAGRDLMLVASDARDLEPLCADLRIRHGVRVAAVAVDLGQLPVQAEPVATAVAAFGGCDALLLPIGWTARSDEVTSDSVLAERLLATNFLAPAALVGRLLPELRKRPSAAVVGFGSVAAVRGRSANVAYAAAKSALQTWFEGLRHASAGTSVRVSFYVLGYLDTALAFGRRTLVPRADPARLAALVVRELGRREGVVYYPAAFRLVAAALPLLPFAIVKRLLKF